MNDALLCYPEAFLRPLWERHYKTKPVGDFFQYLREISEQDDYWSHQRHWFDRFQQNILFQLPHAAAILSCPHLWKKIVHGNRDCFFVRDLYDSIKMRMASVLLRLEGLRKFKRLLIAYHQSAREETLILRNKKDNLPDVHVRIRYYPQRDTYFESAFSGRFKRDLEDGCFVIHTKREGTNQRVLEIYWDIYRRDAAKGRTAVYEYLDAHKTSEDGFSEAVDTILAVSKYDTFGYFVGLAESYIHRYLSDTLYNKGLTSTNRLHQFVTKDTVLARYIWGFNFNTEKKRFALVADLEIATRDQNKLVRSETMEQLKEMIEHKRTTIRKQRSTIYDDLPPQLWERIQKAEKRLREARVGTPVGFRGARYINSEDIQQAEYMVKQAWVDADRYVGKLRSTKCYCV